MPCLQPCGDAGHGPGVSDAADLHGDPFAAGGPTNTAGRRIAEAMSRGLGQSVLVVKVRGAGGTLGAQRVAQARPEGHTILLHHIGMARLPTLYRRLAHDPVNGFETIGMVTERPMTLVGRRDVPAANLADLLGHVRQQGERLARANAGIGAASDLCGLLLLRFTKCIGRAARGS